MQDQIFKVCSKCGIEKYILLFSLDASKRDGRRPDCKKCTSDQRAARVSLNPEAERQRRILWVAMNPEKHKESQAKYRGKNKARTKERASKYYLANSEEIQAKRKIFYKMNPENLEISRKKWKQENPDYIRACTQKRRALKAGAEGSHSASDIKALFANQRGLCANCTKKIFSSGENKFHLDHIQPLSRGGSNWPSNLQCLCPDCNLRKWAKDPLDWAKENGRLL